MNMINKCESCALADLRNTVCQLTGLKITAEDYCSKHQARGSLTTCYSCGHVIIGPHILSIDKDGIYRTYCASCAEQFGTCAMCSKSTSCRLMNDTSITEPLYIQKMMQKGPVSMMRQVINPARIEQTCKAGCECWNGSECNRQCNGTCEKYDEI